MRLAARRHLRFVLPWVLAVLLGSSIGMGVAHAHTAVFPRESNNSWYIPDAISHTGSDKHSGGPTTGAYTNYDHDHFLWGSSDGSRFIVADIGIWNGEVTGSTASWYQPRARFGLMMIYDESENHKVVYSPDSQQDPEDIWYGGCTLIHDQHGTIDFEDWDYDGLSSNELVVIEIEHAAFLDCPSSPMNDFGGMAVIFDPTL